MKFEKSLDLLNRALTVIPKGTQTASKCYDQWAKGTAPIFCESANGCFIYDVDGNRFIDHIMALGPIILGYNHKRTNKAIKEQLKKGTIYSLSSPLEVELSELVCDIVPCAEMVRFGKNGSDVTSIAVRIARHCSGKELVLSPEGHYHGWTDFYAAISPRNYGMPECMKDLVHRFRYNDLADLEKYLGTKKYAAVIMEPMVLDSPNRGYLKGVRELCDKYNTILIFDEMITGFRWALGGAQEYYGVTADIATYGKAASNGMPLALLCGKKKYMEAFDKVFFSGTYLGETLSIAAAIETIKELRERKDEIYPYIWEQGNRMANAFNNYARKINLDAEMFGVGPRHNVRFNVDDDRGAKDLFHQEMVKHGILFGTQIYICVAHNHKHINKTIKAMKESLDIVKKALDEDRLGEMLEGTRSAEIFKQSAAKMG
jgi:glutamate-1-semialdehyde aminotransferase